MQDPKSKACETSDNSQKNVQGEDDSEVEVMQCSVSPEETVDQLIARVVREQQGAAQQQQQQEQQQQQQQQQREISASVDDKVVFDTLQPAEDANSWKFTS